MNSLSLESGALAVPAPDWNGVRAYKGIPYAAPPLGPLRWCPPQPVSPWSGVRRSDAFGPNSLKLGGRAFDQVVLHTFFTDETTARVVQTVKVAAEQAGRDPEQVKVWSCFATVGDHIPEDRRLMKTVGRLGTYLQGYGDLLVRTNGWDPAVLEAFRADPVVQGVAGLDISATTEQLEHVATLLPDEWLAPSATGTPEQCVAAIRNQLDLGCDGVILHGATPSELEPILAAY